MNAPEQDISVSVESLTRISILPLILELTCKATGMGFAVVARVTPDRWVACGVQDNIQFGLRVGGELKADTTICHEILQSGEGVIIDHVAKDEFYCNHDTPAMYGFQSYISLPITVQGGSLYGTLCAIDPGPALLNTPEIIGMFKAFSALISFHLHISQAFPAARAQELEAHSTAVLEDQLQVISAHAAANGSDKKLRSNTLTDAIAQTTATVTGLLKNLRHSIG